MIKYRSATEIYDLAEMAKNQVLDDGILDHVKIIARQKENYERALDDIREAMLEQGKCAEDFRLNQYMYFDWNPRFALKKDQASRLRRTEEHCHLYTYCLKGIMEGNNPPFLNIVHLRAFARELEIDQLQCKVNTSDRYSLYDRYGNFLDYSPLYSIETLYYYVIEATEWKGDIEQYIDTIHRAMKAINRYTTMAYIFGIMSMHVDLDQQRLTVEEYAEKREIHTILDKMLSEVS